MSLTQLGINAQAQAVLILLNGMNCDRLQNRNMQTTTWYNGRERGLCFYVDDFVKRKRRCVAVFEHRNSDDLCALKWEDDININPPLSNLETFERAYKGGNKHNIDFSVGWGEIGKMAMWVRAQLLLIRKEETIDETK